MRTLIAALAAVVLVAASACSSDDQMTPAYAAQTATIGESLAVLGWNMSVSNLRFDGDYVLLDVDASPADPGAPHADPKDIRFGLYGALAHPAEANAIGGCRDLTDLAVQPLSAPAPVRLTGTVCIGPQRDQGPVRGVYVYSPRDRLAGTTTAHPTALGDPGAFTGKGYLLLGLQIDGLATQYRDIAEKRGGPAMVLVTPTLPAPGLSHACDVYGSSALVLPDASRDAVQFRVSLCTQGEINAALLYPTVSLVGTHAGLWTHR